MASEIENSEAGGWMMRLFDESGLISLYRSPRDIKLRCMQRFVRLFAYGASTLILVSYLEALGISKTQTGLFMSLTLAGDICISFVLTLFADGLGRKWILVVGSLLMAVSGVVFAIFGHYWALLIAAIVGFISPRQVERHEYIPACGTDQHCHSGNEIGPFRAIEESIVAHLTKPKERAHIYAWYGLYGSAGTAFGMLTGGLVIDRMLNVLQWDRIQAYRIIFWLYAGVGLLKTALALMLSSNVEMEKKQAEEARPGEAIDETAPLLTDVTPSSQEPPAPKPQKGLRSLLPAISKESVSVVIELCLLFAIDSFASGLASM